MKYNHCISIFMWLIFLQCTCAQASTETEQKTFSDPPTAEKIAAADKLLKRSCDFYRNLDSFSLRLNKDLDMDRSGNVTHKRDSASFEFERSRYLSIKMLKPKPGGQVVLNGLIAHLYNPKWRSYVNRSLPGQSQIFSDSDFIFLTDGTLGDALLQELTSADPYAEIMKNRSIRSYDGLSVVDGESCHKITLRTKGDSCDSYIWLSAGDKPWIKRFMPVRDCPMKIMPVDEKVTPPKMTMTFAYRSLKDNPKIRDNEFKPAAGAKLASDFVASSSGDARNSLVGMTAPKLSVRTIDGGKFVLSKQRGKITVLEFWATWCGPCLRAMPIVEEITKSFSDQGVQYIAIDEKEDPSNVRKFLAEKSSKVRVAVDLNGAIGQRYHVAGIPQIVVIGKDGKVRSIHVGVGPVFKEKITDDVRKVVLENSASKN